MSNGGSSGRPTKNERREAAREKAKVFREQQRKREKRNRFFLQGGIGVGILVVLAIVAVVIVTSIKPPAQGPANMASGGIVIGKGLKAVRTPARDPGAKLIVNTPDPSGKVIRIVTYIDYLCPFCGEFEKTNSVQIGELAKSGAATVEIHPMDLLVNSAQGTKYSLRAANAAVCVANYQPDEYYAFHSILFENQPDENSTGLPDSKIKSLAKKAGVGQLSKIDKCIDKGTYESWVQSTSNLYQLHKKFPGSHGTKWRGTPTVFVNGKLYLGSLTDANEFRAFVLQASGANYKPSATPTPTPTPTG